MTDFPSYYRGNVTWVDEMDQRLSTIADTVIARSPHRVLDLGCGHGVLLDALSRNLPDAQLVGVDAVAPPESAGWSGVTADIAGLLPFAQGSYDVVVAGEVLEHVPHPDLMLSEIHRVLTVSGLLVVSTPNIVMGNRVLVPLGISRCSRDLSRVHLSRRWRSLARATRYRATSKCSPTGLFRRFCTTGSGSCR